jgi:hypothetical protein
MNYLMLIWADGRPAPDELAVMQRELPGWIEEMDGRGVRLLGRELELPETAVTVRVRGDEALVTDGPFAETKEFVAGFDLLDCADLDEAIQVAATSPVSWFHIIEIRQLGDRVRLDEEAERFARLDDSQGTPYLLSTWGSDAPFDDHRVTDEVQAWRQDLKARGVYVLGSSLEDAATARTLRVRRGDTLVSDGPLNDEFISGFDVVNCASRQEAVQLAAQHPIARSHAVEVRQFWSK